MGEPWLHGHTVIRRPAACLKAQAAETSHVDLKAAQTSQVSKSWGLCACSSTCLTVHLHGAVQRDCPGRVQERGRGQQRQRQRHGRDQPRVQELLHRQLADLQAYAVQASALS